MLLTQRPITDQDSEIKRLWDANRVTVSHLLHPSQVRGSWEEGRELQRWRTTVRKLSGPGRAAAHMTSQQLDITAARQHA